MTIAERDRLGKAGNTPWNKDSSLGRAPLKKLPKDTLSLAILFLSVSASFGLGMVAGREGRAGEGDRLWIEKLEQPAAVVEIEKKEEASNMKAAPILTDGEVVASKTGTKYYLPWCGTVKRIKEENKVWFKSKAEAEAAGYEPASNCKGL